MTKFYPKIKPYKKGYLDVGNGHQIYYEMIGNPKGKPVLFLHGGPGSGIEPDDRRFFNPRKFNVVLFDQRGAGKSRPFASLNNNDTWKLVDDINKLLAHLGMKKAFLFGGSWGSTLALAYAIKNPNKITGMLIRGIFLCDSNDQKYYLNGGVAVLFPDAWERFIGNVPQKYRKAPAEYYYRQMKSKNAKIRDKFAKEWTIYELSILKMKMTEKMIKKYLKDGTYKSLGPLEAHYITKMCFMQDNYIIKNAKRLSKIPVVIVHGRYDAICPPLNAWKLHKVLKKSKLYFVTSGHGSSEEELRSKLIEEMDKVA